MPAENISIEARVRALEKANKGHRRAVLILSIILVFYIALTMLLSKTFSGRWVSIDDAKGRISGWWDDNGLELHDANGIVRAKLGLSLGGSPYLQFYDKRHRLRSQLFLYTDGTGYLMLWDKNGKGVRYPPSKTPMP